MPRPVPEWLRIVVTVAISAASGGFVASRWLGGVEAKADTALGDTGDLKPKLDKARLDISAIQAQYADIIRGQDRLEKAIDRLAAEIHR